jgi:hypothetical protein
MLKPDHSNSSPKKESAFWAFFMKSPIDIVSGIPLVVAIVLVVSWGLIKEQFLPDVPQMYNFFVIAFASIIMGCIGIIYIVRKEMPGPVAGKTIKGNCAVISGLILAAFFGILGSIVFILTLLG